MNLTREEIEQLPAGPKMNELIAERILGRIWVHTEKTNNLIDPEDWPVWQVSFNDIEMGKGDESLPVGGAMNYSRDISRAWQVVEHLTAAGWGHKHQVYSAAAECPGWQWTFMRPGGGLGAGIAGAEAETAPLAICRAALQTLLPAAAPSLLKGSHE